MTKTTAEIVHDHAEPRTISFTTPEGIHATIPADLTPQLAGAIARKLERSLRRCEPRVAKRSRGNRAFTDTY